MREPDHAAAELHDQVVRAIFAVGLHLHSTAQIAVDPLVRRRVEKALRDLDGLIRIIWDTVLDLGYHLNDTGPRPGILHLCEHPAPPTPSSPGR
jgi:signal transduction histidine kinase